MEESLFIQYIQEYFPSIVLREVNYLNDTQNENAMRYLHRQMLTKEFSVSGKWESITSVNSLVAADVVAMDSSLPLKKRGSYSSYTGDIPKMGMELTLNEKQLTDIQTMLAVGGQKAAVAAKIFADTPKVIAGIYERNEQIFLEALSTGSATLTDADNVGANITVDYGYNTDNQKGVTTVWSNATSATPWDEIEATIEQAGDEGIAIRTVLLDRTAYKNLVKADQTKELYAYNSGFVGSNIQTPSYDQFNAFAQSRFGLNFMIVDRSVRTEKNGVQTSAKPWADGRVVLLSDTNVGSLVYARLAEQANPVAGVSYQLADQMILVSKFRENRPSLKEFTNSQARCVPVISNVDQIYTIDTLTVEA